jgi:hypothetical protein
MLDQQIANNPPIQSVQHFCHGDGRLNTNRAASTSRQVNLEPQAMKAQQIANNRPNRTPFRRHEDPHVLQSYGDPITNEKQSRTIRIYFQNIKGLSYTTTREDYKYDFNHLDDLQVDIAGLAETNSAWQHQFLRNELIQASRSIGSAQ